MFVHQNNLVLICVCPKISAFPEFKLSVWNKILESGIWNLEFRQKSGTWCKLSSTESDAAISPTTDSITLSVQKGCAQTAGECAHATL